jgi:hypothetical protein
MRLLMLAIVLGTVVTAAVAQEPCPCEQKVCRSTTEVKKTDKRVFGYACEDFCLPKCTWATLMHGGCCDCTCCEDKVRCRKFLVVKIRKEEKCVTKCVVETASSPCSAVPASPKPTEAVPVPKLTTPPK